LLSVALLLGCRKDVTLKLPEYTQKVVVEASIETGEPAVVLLSWSVPYFGEFDYSKPEESFIRGASVVVNNGVTTDTLQELDKSLGYLYMGSRIIGKEQTTYSLTVTVNGNSYTTETRIGTPANFDTLYYRNDHDNLGFIWQRFAEPPGIGDCYRWFAKRKGRDNFYAAPWGSVFEDKFVDGKTFDFGYDRGAQPNQVQQNSDDPERGYYRRGDTVIVKFCKIGRNEYDFWFTYYQNKASNSNPFSAPSNIKSMFADHAHVFGAFTGYATVYDTIVIPLN
jgi:hypothetical protein